MLSAFITSDEREVLEVCFSSECTRKLHIPLTEIEARMGRGLFGLLHALRLQRRELSTHPPVAPTTAFGVD